MLGFSLQKLLVLAIILATVWYGFKFVGRLDAARRSRAKEALKRAASRAAGRPAAPEPPAAEDMVRCRVCGTFVPARRATACGRPDCPYAG